MVWRVYVTTVKLMGNIQTEGKLFDLETVRLLLNTGQGDWQPRAWVNPCNRSVIYCWGFRVLITLMAGVGILDRGMWRSDWNVWYPATYQAEIWPLTNKQCTMWRYVVAMKILSETAFCRIWIIYFDQLRSAEDIKNCTPFYLLSCRAELRQEIFV